MKIVISMFFKKGIELTEVFQKVSGIAFQFKDEFNNDEDVLTEIALANMPKKSSKGVQNVMKNIILKLGFTYEKKGLFHNYPFSGMRPDAFQALLDTGIILEIERGKSIQNNNDVLALFKVHLCKHARYLILFVPQELRQNYVQKNPVRVYEKVCKRVKSFLEDEENYVNIDAIFILGY